MPSSHAGKPSAAPTAADAPSAVRGEAFAVALGWFASWFITLYFGAGHPSLRGFLLIVAVVLAGAAAVYWRYPVYRRWAEARRPHRLGRALAEGALAGVVVALLTVFVPHPAEPGAPPPTLLGWGIWAVILAVMGMLNTAALHAIAAFATGAWRAPRR